MHEDEGFLDLLDLSIDAQDTTNEAVDPSFNMAIVHTAWVFCEEWVTQLDWKDRASLGLFPTSVLTKGETEAADLAGIMTEKCEKTICDWKSKFLETNEIPNSKQEKYVRSGVLWINEDLNKKATCYIHAHVAKKGQANLTAGLFYQRVNENLFPNETLKRGFQAKLA